MPDILSGLWLLISVITTGRGLTSGWTSNARFPGRSPVPSGLFKSPNLEAYTTAMNVSQREGLGADGIMANDRVNLASIPTFRSWQPRSSRWGQLAGRPELGVVEGDEIPYQPWAAKRKQENLANWLDRDAEIGCFKPGIPRAMYMPYKFQIIQGTTRVLMVFEYAGAERTIHLDPVAPYPVDAYMGHAVGHWEGNTLVTDVSNFTSETWLDRSGDFHSDALHVVERFTPITRDAFRYEATIEDKKVFTRPWKISMPIYRRLEPNAQLMEFRCQEMAEETLLGHLRKNQLVKQWEGTTMRRVELPPGRCHPATRSTSAISGQSTNTTVGLHGERAARAVTAPLARGEAGRHSPRRSADTAVRLDLAAPRGFAA
jgi:hypothetical protein